MTGLAVLAFACAGCKNDDDGDTSSDTTDDTGSYWYVGKDGVMFRVDESGSTPSTYALETDSDLLAIACRGAAEAWSVDELLPPELSLRDLHLSIDHAGHVLGDAGTALTTWDLGESWEPIELGTQADLTGLDQLHAQPHL